MELIFKALLVVVNNRVPNSRVRFLINLIASVRPTDNTLVNIVRAVFRIAPAFNVYCRIAQRRCDLPIRTGGRCPVTRCVGIGTQRRANQAENCCFTLIRLIRILVFHNFNALGCPSRGAIGIGDRKRNGCRALAFAGHNTFLIYAKDLRVAAGPLTSVAFSISLFNDHVCKPNRLELSYFISTINCHFRHLGEIGHCDFNGFCNNRSIGSFARTCSIPCALRRYLEGDLNRSFTGRFHTSNRCLCLGCIVRNWCNRRPSRIIGFPSAGIALRVFRQNFGRKVNCFALHHACRFSILAVDLDRGRGWRNRVGHRDRQCSRDCGVIVVRNSKRHGCSAHAPGGDFAGCGVHLKNITVVFYSPSAAFVFCIGRVDYHSFQLALRILGKRELSDCRILTLDLDRGIGDSIHDMDFEGFFGTTPIITMGNDRFACCFAVNFQCGSILFPNDFHMIISAFHRPTVAKPFVAFQRHILLTRIDRYLVVRGRLQAVQVRGDHGIVLFLRFGCLTCGCRRVSCLTCGCRRVSCLTFGFHRFGCLTCGCRRVSCLTCGFHRLGFLTCGCRRFSCLTFGFHRFGCLT